MCLVNHMPVDALITVGILTNTYLEFVNLKYGIALY